MEYNNIIMSPNTCISIVFFKIFPGNTFSKKAGEKVHFNPKYAQKILLSPTKHTKRFTRKVPPPPPIQTWLRACNTWFITIIMILHIFPLYYTCFLFFLFYLCICISLYCNLINQFHKHFCNGEYTYWCLPAKIMQIVAQLDAYFICFIMFFYRFIWQNNLSWIV